MSDERVLETVRRALEALDEAEQERAAAWALAGSGLLDAGERRVAQMEAEHEMEAAHEALRKAREAVPLTVHEDRAWDSH